MKTKKLSLGICESMKELFHDLIISIVYNTHTLNRFIYMFYLCTICTVLYGLFDCVQYTTTKNVEFIQNSLQELVTLHTEQLVCKLRFNCYKCTLCTLQ